jgi:hypothetical protein
MCRRGPGWCEDQDSIVHDAVVLLGHAVHQAFLTQGQEAFLEGHVHAFERLGVPVDKIRYDNLNSAVKQVLFGRSRQENERWISFKSHLRVRSLVLPARTSRQP